MARARTVKLDIMTDRELADAELDTGLPLALAYIGLQLACDPNGVFIWHLGELRKVALPNRAHVDLGAVLEALQAIDYVRRFEAEGSPYGLVTWFLREQKPHAGEPPLYPRPPLELVPTWLHDRLRAEPDPHRSQNRESKTGLENRQRTRASVPDLSDPDPGLDLPLNPPAVDRGAPAARGGIDLSAFDQANRAHFGRPITAPERKILERFLTAGHDGPTLLEIMAANKDKAADSLLGYSISTYHNGGGHVPPARKAPKHRPAASAGEPVYEEASEEEAAEYRRLIAEMARDGLPMGGAA